MALLASIFQLLIGLTILNVWLLRFGRETEYRGGNAKNMREEFAVYGLPSWSVYAIGFLKIVCATLLIAGLWIPEATRPGAAVLALLMAGAVLMHVRVRDPLRKALPAFSLLVLCGLVAMA